MDKQSPEHRKKMVAPIIITVLFLAYLVVYGIAIFTTSELLPGMLLFALPLIALGIGMIYVLKSRIKEIRSGEEDDLDNY